MINLYINKFYKKIVSLRCYNTAFFGCKVLMIKNFKIAIIGLGYVGLPLAVQFAKNMM